MSTSQVLRRSLSICRNDNKPVRLAASNNHRYPEGRDGDAVYLEPLIARLTEAGGAPVLRHEDRDTTAADLLKSVYRYARALAAIGIKRGSLITLFAPNRPDALAVRYAANLLGAATYYLSAPSDPRHRADLLAQTDPELLVLFPETAHLLPAGLGVPIAAIGTNLDGASLRLDEAAASQSSTPVAILARPEDLAVVVSSGGTTGVPRGSCRDFTSYTAMVNVPSPAGRRQIGMIEVRSPAVASGYHNRPDLKASFRDGWFHSNDLGYLDASDYLHVLGRADDIAWIDGTMLSPAGIQETLCRLSSVRDAAVVRDAEAGSWISAVVPWPGSSVDLAQCRQVIAAT